MAITHDFSPDQRDRPERKPPQVDEREIRIDTLIRILLDRKYLISLCAAGGILLSLLMLILSTPVYTARMRVMAAPTSLEQDSPMLPGGIGMLVGFGGDDDVGLFKQYLELFRSSDLAIRLEARRSVMKTIYADQWNEARQVWQPSSSVPKTMKRVLAGMVGLPSWSAPNAYTFANYLEREVVINPRTGAGVRTITFSHPDRQFALNFIIWLNEEIDGLLRERMAERSTSRINYLEERIGNVAKLEHRRVLTQLLLEQERTMMVVQSYRAVAAEMIEAPTVSELPTSPNPLLSLIIGTIFGLTVGAGLAVYLSWRDDRRVSRT